MSFQQKISSLTSVAFIFLLLLSSCAPATTVPAITFTPSATATTTATPLPTPTSTPIPIPRNLLDQKKLLEQKGFVFGEGEIIHQDKDGKVWKVIRFSEDGSAVIRALNENYRGADSSLTAEEVTDISVVPLNVEHDPVLVIKDKDSGNVEKMFLANVDVSERTEAGWIVPIEISQDPFNRTKFVSSSVIHTKHALYSALLAKGSEPWPDNTPNTEFALWTTNVITDNSEYIFGIIDLNFSSAIDSEGNPAVTQPRVIGYGELDTPEGIIVIPMLQLRINDTGESRVMSIGYSGEALNLPGFIPNDLGVVINRGILLYEARGFRTDSGMRYEYGIWIRWLQRMPGVEWLYYNVPDNQPQNLKDLEDDIIWINGADFKELDRKRILRKMGTDEKGVPNAEIITNSELLDRLQQMVLYPTF